MYCPACHHLNNTHDRFCTMCGIPLAAHHYAPTLPNTSPPASPYTSLTVPTSCTPTTMMPTTTIPTAQASAGPTTAPAIALPAVYTPPVGSTQLYGYAPAPATVLPAGTSTAAHGVVSAVNVILPPSGQVVVTTCDEGPRPWLRAPYVVLLGLWRGAAWTALAWVLMVSIVGLLPGVFMINRLPQIMTLKPRRRETRLTVRHGVLTLYSGPARQRPFLLRAVYFVLAGWWFSALWLIAALALCGVTLGPGLPRAFWMFGQAGAVPTLRR